MARVREGDVSAFERLYEKYKDSIMSYAYSWTKKQGTAEEITQETFLRVFRYRDSYSQQAKFSTWLWTIARNLCLDHLRKKKDLLLDEKEGFEGAPIENFSTELADAEALLLEKSDSQDLRECLEALPHRQREATVLRTFGELSYDEIATMMSLSLSSVKSLIHRAKSQLLKCLKKRGTHG